jgi:hypothetical protein
MSLIHDSFIVTDVWREQYITLHMYLTLMNNARKRSNGKQSNEMTLWSKENNNTGKEKN